MTRGRTAVAAVLGAATLLGCTSGGRGGTTSDTQAPSSVATVRATLPSFQGRITSTRTHAGIAGIQVNVYDATVAGNTDDAFPLVKTTTGPDGTYSVRVPRSTTSGVSALLLCVFALDQKFVGQCSAKQRWLDDGLVVPAGSRRYPVAPASLHRIDMSLTPL